MNEKTTDTDHMKAQLRARRCWFLLEAVRDLRTTGAVAPSGRTLARALTAPVSEAGPRPLSVLEAGAGTGAVTRVLIPLLPRGSRLDIVEANPRFAVRLHQLATTHPARVNRSVEAKVHQSYVQDLDTDERYDVIVSGLPLTNFPPAEVERIMARYIDLLHPGGTLTYFAYQGTRAARSLTASRPEARRHAAVDEVMAAYQSRYATGRWAVWANLPPAHVWQLRRPRADDPNDQSPQGQKAR
ncbi:class I SAM-dependent methyltransferase [Streptomyces niveus]|uniref:class I SAM-dependent methyltransferase n=1 Tax=Streptomyces niveus TaxID=193462 RepID=UPI0036D2CFEE